MSSRSKWVWTSLHPLRLRSFRQQCTTKTKGEILTTDERVLMDGVCRYIRDVLLEPRDNFTSVDYHARRRPCCKQARRELAECAHPALRSDLPRRLRTHVVHTPNRAPGRMKRDIAPGKVRLFDSFANPALPMATPTNEELVVLKVAALARERVLNEPFDAVPQLGPNLCSRTTECPWVLGWTEDADVG
jgi:hypothetical protein